MKLKIFEIFHNTTHPDGTKTRSGLRWMKAKGKEELRPVVVLPDALAMFEESRRHMMKTYNLEEL